MRKRILQVVGIIIGMSLWEYILSFPFRFIENWVMGFLAEKMLENWGNVLSFVIVWVVPFLSGMGLIALGFFLRKPRIKSLASNKDRILTELSNFIPEGEHIREQCYNQKDKVPEQYALSWAEKVAVYLDGLGSHYRPTFYNSDGLGTAKIPPMYSSEHQRVALFISYRLMRIQQFLAEFRAGT